MAATPTKEQRSESSAFPPISIRAADLLALGKPFVEFPRYSILDLARTAGILSADICENRDSVTVNGSALLGAEESPRNTFSDWLSGKLQSGHPFVIQDFEKLPGWDSKLFSLEGLIEHSTKKNIPIRNCSTGRDLSFTLRKFSNAARQSYREFKNLYARDLQCPEEWLEKCRTVLPPELQWAGRLDLFQWLPRCARSEVMMAYVGSEGSSSGFHRCFSSTVALNLLVEVSDRPVLCFGTDFESQTKYDSFMASRGASPHVDWLNLGPEELQRADFPLYVHEQKAGDLVVFPPATAHQVWNLGSVSTKMVWNILHPLSLEAGLNYVQPPFNRLCHPDVARSNLSLACAMLSLLREESGSSIQIPPDLPLLTRLFRQMVQDESISDPPATAINQVQIPDTAIATCNFCGTAIWNRHLRCDECQDFDLCLLCFLSGRSCEHLSSYSWAEIVPQGTCSRVIQRAEQLLGHKPETNGETAQRKSLGTAANDLMKARQSNAVKLCHLCRIDHLEWKGRRCDTCSAFFCFRGLFRHFDMNSGDVMRHAGFWVCPKCSEICNCRCCHFASAYVKAEKPASKRRVKPADPRGKVMGFTDNVFDQKRRTPAPSTSANPTFAIPPPRSHKRPLSITDSPVQGPQRPSVPRSDLRTPDSETSYSFYGRDIENRLSESGLPDGIPTVKAPRLNGSSTMHSNSHGETSGAKTLHGIDYITQMPTPQDDELSLPPLKPQTSAQKEPHRTAGSSSSRMSANDGMTTLANVAATTSKTDGRQGPYEPQYSRDVKSEIISAGAPTPMTPAPRNAHPYLTPSSTSTSTQFSSNTTSLPSISQNGNVPSVDTQDTSAPPPNNQNPHLPTLESQIYRLRQYADELLALSLHDSHRLLTAEIHRLEDRLRLAKKERSERLVRGLETEFPGLVALREGVKREGGKLGYF